MKQSYHFLFILFLVCFTSKLYSQSVPSYVPTNGLVGWWGFNGNAQDGSGNGNHVLNNNCGFTFDRFGQNNSAVDLVGPNKWLGGSNTLGQPIISLGPVSTVNIWVKIINNSFGEIYHEGGGGNPKGFGLLVSGSFPVLLGTRLAVLDNGVSGNVTGISQGGGYNLGLSQWVNVTLVKNGNSVLLYINGTFNSSGVLSFTSLTSGWLNFGVPDIGEGNLDCHLDDIGIWNRALTQQEITNLYNSQLPTQTSLCLPTITTNTPTSIGIDSVVIGGDILNDGGSSIVLRGVCYSTTPNPNMGNPRTEDGSGIGSFTSTLRNLSPSTTYYARSYAKNSQGVVVYGNEVSFSTGIPIPGIRCPGTPTVTDIDGNIYHTVQIGTQCWTQSNLKVSKYRNGDNIPTGLSNIVWQNTTAGAYAIYNNDPVNDGLYGKLYNHYAVTDTRGLCPTGWHIPTDGEWTTLETFLGGYSVAGGALKSTAVQPTPGGWVSPNTGATNSSGFTALPGGHRSNNGAFNFVGSYAAWWSSSLSGSNIWYRGLYSHHGDFHRGYDINRTSGGSVRCLKD